MRHVFCWLLIAMAAPAAADETLYNGIVLPNDWPPRSAGFSREPKPAPPYLKNRPAVIPIDIGRQLLVDDFLIESTTLEREFHLPKWHPESPVLKAEEWWEIRDQTPFAAPFSDGVWFDPADRKWKLWYLGGTSAFFCYATSADGVRWDRPKLDGFAKDTNILKVEPIQRDSSTIWLDLEERDPARRFKMFYYRAGAHMRFSADGIRWSDIVWSTRDAGDRSTMFYNPFRKVWVFSVRSSANPVGRCRYYAETRDPGVLPWNRFEDLAAWHSADERDKVRGGPYVDKLPDLYDLDATPYESLMLGLFVVHSKVAEGDRPKINHVTLGYSRDGFHWHRPDRRAFLNVSEDKTAWNYGNVQPAGGGCLVMRDKLYFYCSGRNARKPQDDGTGGSTGLAVLRRDGFASMTAGAAPGELTTRPLTFSGSQLFVNVDATGSELRAEMLDAEGMVVPGFGRDTCLPVRGDGTLMPVAWQGKADLKSFAGKTVRFRFVLKKGRLYSFWVSPDESGASHGYVAAGGPGFTSNRDTLGRAVLAD